MGAIKDFGNFLKGLLTGKDRELVITQDDISRFINSRTAKELSLYRFALFSAVDIIANALSKCEIRTFSEGREVKGDEYFRWNFQPNQNTNASLFMHQVVRELVLRGECLVVSAASGDLLVADSYRHEGYAYYPDIFRDVVIRPDATAPQQVTLQKVFRSDEVLFYKLSNQNVTNLLAALGEKYEEMLSDAFGKLKLAGGEHGILKIDAKAVSATYGKNADGTPKTFTQVFAEMTSRDFVNYFKNTNSVLPLWDGFSYETVNSGQKRNTSEVKDFLDISDEIFSVVARAFLIPPAILKGDIADVDKLTQNMLAFAVDPIAKMIEKENNRKRSGKAALKGTYQMIDTARIMRVDILEHADHLYNLMGAGYSVDEIRRIAGDAPLNEEWSTKHFISLNFAGFEDMEKGGRIGGDGNNSAGGNAAKNNGEEDAGSGSEGQGDKG